MPRSLTEKERNAAARALRAKGIEPTAVNIAEEAAVNPRSGSASDDLEAPKMGERKAPAGSIEEKLLREAEEKKKKGPPASMLP